MEKFLLAAALGTLLSGKALAVSVGQNFVQAEQLIYSGSVGDLARVATPALLNQVYDCRTLLNTAIQSIVITENGPNLSLPEDAVAKIRILIAGGADVNKQPCQTGTMAPLSWTISLLTQSEIQEREFIDAVDSKLKQTNGTCEVPGILSAKPCSQVSERDRKAVRGVYRDVFKQIREAQMPYIMEVIKLLVENGADINAQDAGGLAPLHLAANVSKGESLEPLKYLISRKADLDIRDNNGNTPLFSAIAADNNEAIRLLINAGANPKIRNKSGLLYTQERRGSRYDIIRKEP